MTKATNSRTVLEGCGLAGRFLSVGKEKAMNGQAGFLRKFHFNVNSRVSTFAMALAMVFALTLLTTHAMQAQTFSVLHYFTGGTDGGIPDAGVTVGPGGVLYGTTYEGGTYYQGTAFKLNQVSSSWVFSPLYQFDGGAGSGPAGGVVIGPNGALYGTTNTGGGGYNDGLVFKLQPPPVFCRTAPCSWNNTGLYAFTGLPDGAYPNFENLAFDRAGNIYGTTFRGGMYDLGTTFELTPSNGGYTESILHSFGSGTDGQVPYAGVVLDTAGDVYGTTAEGGTGGYGTVYQLMPSNGGWVENVLVNFDGSNGEEPSGGLIIDHSGNLYGTTQFNVFKLTPSGGGFTYSEIYRIPFR